MQGPLSLSNSAAVYQYVRAAPFIAANPPGSIIAFLMMKITVNGDPRELPAGTTVAQLLEQLKFTPRNVAVELNRRLLRSDRYVTVLTEGDAVEIVTFVGGGY